MPPSTDLNADLLQARLHLHRSIAGNSVLASGLAAVVTMLVLWGQAPTGLLPVWLAALATALGVRLGIARWHGRAAEGAAPTTWLKRYRLAFLLHGLVWGGLAAVLTPTLDHAGVDTLVFVLVALAGGGLVAGAFDLAAGMLFATPAVVPLAIRLLGLGEDHGLGLVALGLLFLSVMVIAARRSGHALRELLRARASASERSEAARRSAASAEAALRALADQHGLMDQLLHGTSQGYWFIDTEGRTTDLNPAMCTMLGRPREQVLGRRAGEFFEGAELAVLQRELAARRRGRTGAYEIDIVRPDGTRLHALNNATPLADSEGRAVGSVGLWTDLTAQKRTEEELQAAEAEQRALLEAFPGCIASVDGELRYLYANARFSGLMGRPPEQIIGRTVSELIGPERARVNAREVARASSGEIVRVERSYPAAPGRPRIDLEVTHVAGPARADGHRVFYAFGIDITARSLAQEALIAARDDAERANRAKSQFLAHMSHELRTPMNAIVGFAQLLEHDGRPRLAEHQQGYVREIQRGARHLLGLINEVLDLGLIEAGLLVVERGAVPLHEVADECQMLVQPLALQREVRLFTSVGAARELTAWADRTRLKQVLLNLLGNGVKYNRPGGEVGIDWHRDGDRVLIEVRDTGIGIEGRDLERLFQPFERLGAERSGVEGTGIGLALSRRLAQAMDGDIEVHSEPGVGSTFRVSLPSVPAPAAAPGAGDAALAPDKHRVLYIEDNPVNVVLMEAMLAHLPEVQLECAALPVDGLQRALRDPPDLVLLDIQMPGMDGFEVLARLRANGATAALPVLAVSANAMQADRDAALAAGFVDYLTKPLDLERLREAVRRQLIRARAGAAVGR